MANDVLSAANALLRRAGLSSVAALTTPTQNTSRVIEAIDTAQKNIAHLHDWSTLLTLDKTFTTTASSRDLDLTVSTGLKIDPHRGLARVYRTSPSYFRITEAGEEEWERRTSSTISGSPQVYRRAGVDSAGDLQLKLDPRPSSAISILIDYYGIPEDISSSSGATILRFPQDLVVWEAMTIYLDTVGDDYNFALSKRNEALQLAKRMDTTEKRYVMGTGGGIFQRGPFPTLDPSKWDIPVTWED